MPSFSFWAASQASTRVYLHPPVLQNVLSADSSVGKETACSERDPGSIPGWGRSTGEGIGYPLWYSWASLASQLVKNPPAVWEIWVRSLGWEDPLAKGKATHSFWPGEFNGLYSPWGRKESDMTEWPLLSPEDPRRQSIDLTAEVPVGLTKEGLFTSLS